MKKAFISVCAAIPLSGCCFPMPGPGSSPASSAASPTAQTASDRPLQVRRVPPAATAAEAIEQWRVADDSSFALLREALDEKFQMNPRAQWGHYLAEWEWRVHRRDAEAAWLAFQCRTLDKPLHAYQAASQQHAAKVDALLAAKVQFGADNDAYYALPPSTAAAERERLRVQQEKSKKLEAQAQDDVYAASKAADDQMSLLRDQCKRPFPVPAPGPLPPDLVSEPGDDVALDAPPRDAAEARRRWEEAEVNISRDLREWNALRSEPPSMERHRRSSELRRDRGRAEIAESDGRAAWYALACPDLAPRYLEFRRLAEQEHRLLGSLTPLRVLKEIHNAAIEADPRKRPPHAEAVNREVQLSAYVDRLGLARAAIERTMRVACPRTSVK